MGFVTITPASAILAPLLRKFCGRSVISCLQCPIATAWNTVTNGVLAFLRRERPMQSKDFRHSAAECARLARESSDAFVRQYLTELAMEFRKQAEATEEREEHPRGRGTKTLPSAKLMQH
jgi:hypothetical protein